MEQLCYVIWIRIKHLTPLIKRRLIYYSCGPYTEPFQSLGFHFSDDKVDGDEEPDLKKVKFDDDRPEELILTMSEVMHKTNSQ